MKFLSYELAGRERFGAVRNGQVIDLAARMPDCSSLKAVLADGALDRAEALARGADGDCALDEIRFLPPVPDAGKIVCIGVNYNDRNEEYRDGSAAPKHPSVFMRTRESIIGHLQPLLRPPESEQLDYEGEIVLVIGKEGRRIPEARAREHIAGLSLMNEGSLRDWMRHSKFNVTPGKNFERSGSMGPWLVPVDQFDRFDRLQLHTRVNGELRQDDRTDNLFFSFEKLVSYLSAFMPLHPGDLISTGTPTGAGVRMDPPRFLRPGDMVEVEVPGIGCLQNGVLDEAEAPTQALTERADAVQPESAPCTDRPEPKPET